MRQRRGITRTAGAVGAALGALALAGCGGSDGVSPASCAQLNGMTIPASDIGLATRGATVTAADVVAAAGTGAAAVGEYCRVTGTIAPVDTTAPNIRFQVNLPSDWNRKAMMFGGGGYNGSVATGTGNVPAGPTNAPTPLGRGYATFGSDSGHQAGAAGSRDGSFGANDEALRNYAGDAIKKTRDVAMAIIDRRYAAPVDKTYFAGGSTGGREALVAVSNWPADFDGAIVLYPAWNGVALNLKLGQMTRQMAQPNAYPNRAKRGVVFDASTAACDALDGVADGLISNQPACNASFNLATATLKGAPVRCPGGVDTGDSCLSDPQIATFKQFDQPIALPYTLASGEKGHPGFNVWGTDFGMPSTSPLQPTVVTLAWGTEQPANPMPPVTAATMPPYGSTFWSEFVKHFVTRDPSFNSLTLDPQNPGAFQSRIVQLSGIQEVTRTDLSAFRARGGKILMAHGTHDALVSTRSSQLYWSRVRSTMGASTVDSFMRYYEIPGYGHAVSSVFNAAWDSLTALDRWVETGTAPTNQVVTDTAGVPGRTRPLCEYPAFPRYKGSGDVNAAASYSCATS